MLPFVLIFIFALAHLANQTPTTLSVANILLINSNDPDKDLLNDPCAQKSFPDVNQCFHESALVANSLEDVKYWCCLLWKARDCYETSGKVSIITIFNYQVSTI